MIISHAHRFVFIKTRKTAGTSIEIELSKHCGPEDIITTISPNDEVLRGAHGGRVAQNFSTNKALTREYQRAALAGNCDEVARIRHQIKRKYYNHMPISKVMEQSGQLDDYFWFTAERHPCDRILSYIYHRKRPDKPLSFIRRASNVMKYAPSTSFQNFHLYSVRGKVAVDAIINYDYLERDFCLICDRIGIKAPEKLITTKNTTRKSRSKPLSRIERAVVRAFCSMEIAALSSHSVLSLGKSAS